MSVLALSHVWKYSKQKNGNLLVHLALADFADDDGVCFPSIKRLMEKSRLKERAVQYAIREMIEGGELTILEDGGLKEGLGRMANTYRVNLSGQPQTTANIPEQSKGANNAPLPKGCKIRQERVQNTTGKGAPQCTPTVIEPSLNHKDGFLFDDLEETKKPNPVTDNPQFKIEWGTYIQYRKKKNLSSLLPESIALQFKDFEKWGLTKTILAIQNTMRNGWTGIFEPRTMEPKPTPQDKERSRLKMV